MLDEDPLTLLTGELEHKPELPILLDLLAEAEERAGAPVLRRWVRAQGPSGGRSTACWRATSAPSRTRCRRSPSAASCCARAADAQSSSGSGRLGPGQVPVK